MLAINSWRIYFSLILFFAGGCSAPSPDEIGVADKTGEELIRVAEMSSSVKKLEPARFYYRFEGGRRYSLDVYGLGDDGSNKLRPALIFFHGGGWKGGGKRQFSRQARILTQRTRLIVLSANYPTNGDAVEATRAAQSAICWLRKNAARFAVDPQRIAISGASAGGQLAVASLEVDVGNIAACRGVRQPLGNALVLFNPVLDMKGKWERQQHMDLVGVSPIDQLTRPLPPTLILQGTADKVAPIGVARSFVAKARAVGSRNIRLVEYPGRPHAFFNKEETGDFSATMEELIHFLSELNWI